MFVGQLTGEEDITIPRMSRWLTSIPRAAQKRLAYRAEDIRNLPDALDVLPPPGLSVDTKANECQNKLRRLAPDDAKHYRTTTE